eukprot:6367679-Amphidinium_carterae.1
MSFAIIMVPMVLSLLLTRSSPNSAKFSRKFIRTDPPFHGVLVKFWLKSSFVYLFGGQRPCGLSVQNELCPTNLRSPNDVVQKTSESPHAAKGIPKR